MTGWEARACTCTQARPSAWWLQVELGLQENVFA